MHFFNRTNISIVMTIIGLIASTLYISCKISPSTGSSKSFTLKELNNDVDTIRFILKRHILYDSIKADSALLKQGLQLNEKGENKLKNYSWSRFYFHYNPDFLVWILFIIILLTLSFGLVPLLVAQYASVMGEFKANGGDLISSIFLSFLAGLAIIFVNSSFGEYYFSYKDWIKELEILLVDKNVFYVVIGIPLFTGLIALSGMVLVSRSISWLNVKNSDAANFLQYFSSFYFK